MVQSERKSSIRVEGLNRLIAQVNRVAGNIANEQLMGEIGAFIEFSILQRTAKGEDVEGKRFEPYSPKYKLFRRKTGHKYNIVNLFYSGSMLSALTHTAFKDRVEVYFMNTYGKTPRGKPSTVSNPQKAFFLNEKREFFAISADEENAIWEMIQAHLRRLLD